MQPIWEGKNLRSTGFRKLTSVLLASVLMFSLCGMATPATGDGTASSDTETAENDKAAEAKASETVQLPADTKTDTQTSETPQSPSDTTKTQPSQTSQTPADQKTETPQSWAVRYYIQNAALDGYAVALSGETADKSSVDEAAAEDAFKAYAEAGFYHFNRIAETADGSCVEVYFDLNRYTFTFEPDSSLDLGLADLDVTGSATGDTSVEVWLGKTIDWPACKPTSGKIGGYDADAVMEHVSFTGWQKDGGNRCATGHYMVTGNMIANGSAIPAAGSKVAYTACYSLAGISANIHYLLQQLDGTTYTEDKSLMSTISIAAFTGLTGKLISGYQYDVGGTTSPSLWKLIAAFATGGTVDYYLKYDRADETVYYYDGTKRLQSETYKYGQTVTPAFIPTGTGTKTFAGWEDANGSAVTSFTMPALSVYLYAKWTGGGTPAADRFTVRWFNAGTLLKTDSVERGKTPAFAGSTPAKADDDKYTYSFSGWNTDTDAVAALDTLPAATADADYYAIFTRAAKTLPAQPTGEAYYTVVFKNWNGHTLKTERVKSGGDATPPAAPVRSGYTFAGWDKAYTNITADTSVTAKFTYNGTGGGTGGTGTVTTAPTTATAPGTTSIPDTDAPKADQPSPSSSTSGEVTIPDEEVPKTNQPVSGGTVAGTKGGAPAASAPVTIQDDETPKAASASPKTGDSRAVELFSILAAVSAAGLGVIRFRGRSKNRNGNR